MKDNGNVFETIYLYTIVSITFPVVEESVQLTLTPSLAHSLTHSEGRERKPKQQAHLNSHLKWGKGISVVFVPGT